MMDNLYTGRYTKTSIATSFTIKLSKREVSKQCLTVIQ
jgi:hypothetical protein